MQDINELKEISIIDFCNNNGIVLDKQHGKYVNLKEHDSLVINAEKNRFIWNSKQITGDLIDFVKAIYNVDFNKAIQIINGSCNITRQIKKTSKEKKEDFKTEFDIKNVHQVNYFKHAYAYLIQTRKLSPETINYFYKKGILRQDIHNNVIIYMLNEKKQPIGAFLKGTNTNYPFECIIPGTPNTGIVIKFCEVPKNIYYFESFIDLMSYFEMFPKKIKNAAFIALHGVKINCLKDSFKQFKAAEIMILAVDNDKGGNKFWETIINDEELKDININRELPKTKDWNEDIKALKKQRG